MNDIPKPRRTRADALRNREQILHAAVDLLVDQGPNVPLDMIAKRAKVGIATLYRHFPDRMVLLRQVALDVLAQSTTDANAALREEPDAFTALARYLHDAVDLRIGMVMPMLAERVPMDDELMAARASSKSALEALVKAAHDEESLRPDIGPGDISLLLIRMSPPLPVPFSEADNHRLSHRHLELVLDGMLRFLAVDSLPGRPLGLNELGAMPQDADGNYKTVLGDGTTRCRRGDGRPGSALRNEAAAGNGDRSTTNGS
jgi:AcrR family transcriptional regulator